MINKSTVEIQIAEKARKFREVYGSFLDLRIKDGIIAIF